MLGFSLEPLCHTKHHDKDIFYPPTHLKVRLTFCVTKWVWTSPLSKITLVIRHFNIHLTIK